jgi:hypothetical protein
VQSYSTNSEGLTFSLLFFSEEKKKTFRHFLLSLLSIDYSRTSSLQIHLRNSKLNKADSSKSHQTNKKIAKALTAPLFTQLLDRPTPSQIAKPQTEKEENLKDDGAQQDSRRTTTLLEPKRAPGSRPCT